MAVGRWLLPRRFSSTASIQTHGETRRTDLLGPPNHALTIGFPAVRARGRAPVDFLALSRDQEAGETSVGRVKLF